MTSKLVRPSCLARTWHESQLHHARALLIFATIFVSLGSLSGLLTRKGETLADGNGLPEDHAEFSTFYFCFPAKHRCTPVMLITVGN